MCRNDSVGVTGIAGRNSILLEEVAQSQFNLGGGVTMSGMRGYHKTVRGGVP
jgi:hypothetical protein